MKREPPNNTLVVVTVRSKSGQSCPCSGFVEDFKIENGKAMYQVWLDVDQDDKPTWFPAEDVRRMLA